MRMDGMDGMRGWGMGGWGIGGRSLVQTDLRHCVLLKVLPLQLWARLLGDTIDNGDGLGNHLAVDFEHRQLAERRGWLEVRPQHVGPKSRAPRSDPGEAGLLCAERGPETFGHHFEVRQLHWRTHGQAEEAFTEKKERQRRQTRCAIGDIHDYMMHGNRGDRYNIESVIFYR